MNSSTKAAGAFALGALVLTLGYGFVQVTSQEVPIFTKNGSTVTILPGTTLALETLTAGITTTGVTKTSTLTEGGGTRATTSGASATFLASDFDVERVIEVNPSVAGITLTLPATSTLTSFVPNSGDCRDLRIVNATGTANIALTIAGGTGSLLKNGSSTAIIMTGNAADMTACRRPNTDIIFSFKN